MHRAIEISCPLLLCSILSYFLTFLLTYFLSFFLSSGRIDVVVLLRQHDHTTAPLHLDPPPGPAKSSQSSGRGRDGNCLHPGTPPTTHTHTHTPPIYPLLTMLTIIIYPPTYTSCPTVVAADCVMGLPSLLTHLPPTHIVDHYHLPTSPYYVPYLIIYLPINHTQLLRLIVSWTYPLYSPTYPLLTLLTIIIYPPTYPAL